MDSNGQYLQEHKGPLFKREAHVELWTTKSLPQTMVLSFGTTVNFHFFIPSLHFTALLALKTNEVIPCYNYITDFMQT